MLRFESEAELNRAKQQKRERYNSGAVHASEKDIQAAALELLAHHPAVAFAYRMNTGAGFLLYPDTYKRLVASHALNPDEARFIRFGIPGQYDVTGMLRGGRRFELELKGDKGRDRPEQVAFGQAVNGGGGLAIVARSIDEVLEGLR